VVLDLIPHTFTIGIYKRMPVNGERYIARRTRATEEEL